ncbi:glycoside hydrolase family 127 protein [Paenibacillus aestuarii]|uniref:Glycoside hydrolase family 127 protein n=1 Tax=Paenibacillus aestuarii TaxID=516965 RepID=A0ABW0K3M1_9BACL|nr:beta-L-arabinofuranosidase domain-containing protein [Paenibacillus aestuarii]
MRNVTVANPFSLQHVQITDDFWADYVHLVRHEVVPYQWQALNDLIDGVEPSHAVKNLKIAAGLEQGEYYGFVFQDSDLAKWLEAVGHLLATEADPVLEKTADELIELIAKAQQDDGYLNTYFTVKEPNKRWTNLTECHELYCAGHLIEAAVAYYQATGKRRLLDVACRLADYIDSVFGVEPGQIRGYDGHQEIELALVKLYQVTQEERYLRLSQYFLEERGQKPHFFALEYEQRQGKTHFPMFGKGVDLAYFQSHVPVREQETAEGHAVRLVYMCAGMADVAAATGDQGLVQACRTLWNNVVHKRMYITGAIGSMAQGEAFSLDYDLPGDTAYAETCASIGLIFFAQRMLQLEAKSEYADVMERALYNTVIGGMARDGRSFFYVNPLEVWPLGAHKNKNFQHVKTVRQGWFGCACCPPNIARLLASLGRYIYSYRDRTVFAHLYIGSEACFEIEGVPVSLKQQSQLPWEGDVSFEVTHGQEELAFTLALRLPDWCKDITIVAGEAPVDIQQVEADGYAYIKRKWKSGERVKLQLAMTVNRMRANPQVRYTAGKAALQRGPLVYCMEEADNGTNLHQVLLGAEGEEQVRFESGLLGGISTLSVPAMRSKGKAWGDRLYAADVKNDEEPIQATFIPYYAWANRGEGEMTVWVREN